MPSAESVLILICAAVCFGLALAPRLPAETKFCAVMALLFLGLAIGRRR